MSAAPWLEVVSPGAYASVQDAGRRGWRRVGAPVELGGGRAIAAGAAAAGGAAQAALGEPGEADVHIPS